MKTKNVLLLLFLLVFGIGATSCVSDDWDDDYDDYDDYGYYDPGYGHRHRHYDDRRYEHERRERERYEREHDHHGDRGHGNPPRGFTQAGSFKAGNAVECGIPTSHKISKVRITATSGTVSINTVVLREGSAKTSFTVARRLNSGESADIDLGGSRQATGLRISTGGKGNFSVYVR